MSTNDILTIINIILVLLTLCAVIIQSIYAARNFKLLVINMRYNKHFETSKFLLDNPLLIDYAVRQETLIEFSKIEDRDLDIRKKKIYLDMILDNAEFFYISSKYNDKEHNMRLVKRMMTNERIKDHWKSKYRGSVRKDFESFIDEFYETQTAKR